MPLMIRAVLRNATVAVLVVLFVAPRARAGEAPLTFGLTAVILQNRSAFLDRWRQYLARRIERPVRFVQRRSYSEITELIGSGELDVAWVCGYPFVRNRERMRLLAVPHWNGRPLYQSYLIVPAGDVRTRDFADLKGDVFAYSDPNSNSGFLVPRYEMLSARLNPKRLFRKTFFTWAHEDVVRAVAEGLAQGGAVDGYIWETLARIKPALTARTRVVRKSEWYGFPPLVTRTDLPASEFARLRAVLMGMGDDPAGRRLLAEMNLDGFGNDGPRIFDGVERIMHFVDAINARQP